MPVFLGALEQAGWIKKNQPVAESHFWNLLQGDRAEMSGVFSPYELQVIHDWIHGAASVDGASFEPSTAADAANAADTARVPRRPVSFRVAERLRRARTSSPCADSEPPLDTDLAILRERLPQLGPAEQRALLVRAMSPALHWTPPDWPPRKPSLSAARPFDGIPGGGITRMRAARYSSINSFQRLLHKG